MKLKGLILGDIRQQYKYGFYALYTLFTLVYITVLRILPMPWKELCTTTLIFSDPVLIGLMFMGAIILFEKSEKVMQALAVSPISIHAYILSKVISIGLISLLSGVLIALFSGMEHSYIHLAVGIMLGSALFTLVGISLSAFISTMNNFMLIMVPTLIISVAPISVYTMGYKSGAMLLHPSISLIELIEAIHEIEGIKRIRLGSLEPRIITEEFAKRIARLEKICPHFHLSLQSGCDKTLKAMNRKYNTEEYYEGCVKLREVFDNPAITTDVIVGFPGETEEDFLETRKFLEKVHFYEMHIFKYSRRKGTVADKMKEQVADTVKSERSAVLLALEKAQSLEYRKMYIGKRLEVLIEELTEIDGRSYYTGYTKNYIRVAIAADEFKDNPVNDIYECMADKLICDGVTILARCN